MRIPPAISFVGVNLGWLGLATLKAVRPDVAAFSQLWGLYGVGGRWPEVVYWCAVCVELAVVAAALNPRTRRLGLWASFWLATALVWANIGLAADRMTCGCFGGFYLPGWAKYTVLAALLLGSAHQLCLRPSSRVGTGATAPQVARR